MDINSSLNFVNTLIEHGYTDELANTANDFWFNMVGKRVLKARIKNTVELQKYHNDLQNELIKVPKSEISEPKLSILGPALEASKYYIDVPTIRHLFAKAAAGSFNKNLQNKILPSYIPIITQLSDLDVYILDYLSGNVYINNLTLNPGSRDLPLMDLSYRSNRFSNKIYENIVPKEFLSIIANKTPYKINYEDLFVSIDNLKRLGIVNINNSKLKTWNSKSVEEIFNEHELEIKASEVQMSNINNLEEQLSGNKSKEISPNNYEISIVIPSDTKENIQENINLFKEMSIHKDFKTLKLTSYGKRFCSICI